MGNSPTEYRLRNGAVVRTTAKSRYLIVGGRGVILHRRDTLPRVIQLLQNQWAADPWQWLEVIDQETGDTMQLNEDQTDLERTP